MRVQFNFASEFLDELRLDCREVEDKIIRLCVRSTQEPVAPVVHQSVCATCLIRGKVVRLDDYQGNALYGLDSATRLKDKTNAALDALSAQCRELGLDVRAGILEECSR